VNSYALIYLVGYIAPAFVGFLAMIVYTHLLSPSEYGVYVIGTGIAGIISTVFFTWIRQSVSRYQASHPDLDLRPEAAVAYRGTVIVILCLAPAALLIARPDFSVGVLAGSALLSLSLTAFEISQEFRRAKLNPLRFMTIAVMRSGLALGLGYVAIKLGGGGLGLLVAMGASFLIANLLTVPRDVAKAQRGFSTDHLMQFLRYGLPFSLGAIAISLHAALDRLGVAYLLGPSGAGYYGLASDIARQLIVLFGASVAAAMFPVVFRTLAQSGAAATRERLKEGMELLLAIVVPAAAWLSICSNVIAGTLLGSEFQATVAVLLPLVALARMLGAVNQYYLQISFQLAEKPLLQVAHDISILTLNLGLLFPLTLTFGLPGTAMAVLIAEGVGILIGTALSRRGFRLPLNGPGIVRVGAATSVMAIVAYGAQTLVGQHGLGALIITAASSGLAYAGAAVLLDVAGIRTMLASLLRHGIRNDPPTILPRGVPQPSERL
jgi:O-antigen/teichoic acid export membrane protein